MNPKHCRLAFPALAAAGTLLLLGCTMSMPTNRDAASSPDAMLADETPSQEKPRRQARRVRASLSLPYFSFARPLNPRS